MHTHELCELYHFMGGEGIFRIEGSSYPLRAGDVLIMRPTEAHYIDIDPRQPYTRLAVHFDPAILSSVDPNGSLLKPFFDRPAGKRNLYRKTELSPICRELLREITSDGYNRRLQILSNLIPLLNEILHTFEHSKNESSGDTLDYKIVSYINERLSEPLSLDDICRNFFISKPQLCRLFKNATGSTVWDYITVKRLVNAKRLIQSGASATKVCSECGFNDYSAFYRAYKKKYGCSPAENQP